MRRWQMEKMRFIFINNKNVSFPCLLGPKLLQKSNALIKIVKANRKRLHALGIGQEMKAANAHHTYIYAFTPCVTDG